VVHWSEARAIAEGANLPLVGPTAGIGYLGPLYYYLLAIPASLNPDPLAGGYFIALLGALSVYACYRLARGLFGEGAAIAAALLYALAPYAIRYSSFIWNPNLLPLFTVLLIASTAKALKGDGRWAIPALAMAAVMVQLHLTALAVIPYLAVLGLAARRNLRLRHLALGLIASLAILSPFLYHEYREYGLRELFLDVRGAAAEGRLTPSAADEAKVLSAAAEAIAGPFGSGVQALGAFASLAIFTLSFPALVLEAAKGPSRLGARLCLLWMGCTMGVLMAFYVGTVRFYNLGVPVHYLLILYPVPYVGMGLLISRLHRLRRAPAGAPISYALLALAVSGQAIATATLIRDEGMNSLTLAGMRSIIAIIDRDASGPFRATVIPERGQGTGLNYLASLGGRLGDGGEYIVVDESLGQTTLADVTRSLPPVGSAGPLKVYRLR